MDERNLTSQERFSISAVPPFNFELSAQVFSDGDPQVRRYEKGRFHQVVRIGNESALISVESIGTVEKPRLSVELKTKRKLTESEKENAGKIVSSLFNLDFNLTAFYEEVRNDKIMSGLSRKLLGLKSPKTQFVFEALVDLIVEQQISLKLLIPLKEELSRSGVMHCVWQTKSSMLIQLRRVWQQQLSRSFAQLA